MDLSKAPSKRLAGMVLQGRLELGQIPYVKRNEVEQELKALKAKPKAKKSARKK